MLGAVGVGGDKWQTDIRLERPGELDLRLLRSLGQPLQRLPVFSQIDAVVALKFFGQPVNDLLVKVVAAQVRVAGSGTNLKDAVTHVENRNVEGSSAQVEHKDGLIFLLVQAVGERGGGRLIDD